MAAIEFRQFFWANCDCSDDAYQKTLCCKLALSLEKAQRDTAELF